MGSQHKRRLTGGKKPHHHKKRKHEMGRQMAMTKIGAKRIHKIRVRGGNSKFRALRLDTGNFSWGSEVCTRKTRVLDVVYNASNNELVRTKTLVKSAIVQVDATPFRQWYEAHYGVRGGKRDGRSTRTSTASLTLGACLLASHRALANVGAVMATSSRAKSSSSMLSAWLGRRSELVVTKDAHATCLCRKKLPVSKPSLFDSDSGWAPTIMFLNLVPVSILIVESL